MSHGHGKVQLEILEALARLPDGHLLLVGDGGWSYRRAARKLEAEGLVSLAHIKHDGRHKVGARLARYGHRDKGVGGSGARNLRIA